MTASTLLAWMSSGCSVPGGVSAAKSTSVLSQQRGRAQQHVHECLCACAGGIQRAEGQRNEETGRQRDRDGRRKRNQVGEAAHVRSPVAGLYWTISRTCSAPGRPQLSLMQGKHTGRAAGVRRRARGAARGRTDVDCRVVRGFPAPDGLGRGWVCPLRHLERCVRSPASEPAGGRPCVPSDAHNRARACTHSPRTTSTGECAAPWPASLISLKWMAGGTHRWRGWVQHAGVLRSGTPPAGENSDELWICSLVSSAPWGRPAGIDGIIGAMGGRGAAEEGLVSSIEARGHRDGGDATRVGAASSCADCAADASVDDAAARRDESNERHH